MTGRPGGGGGRREPVPQVRARRPPPPPGLPVMRPHGGTAGRRRRTVGARARGAERVRRGGTHAGILRIVRDLRGRGRLMPDFIEGPFWLVFTFLVVVVFLRAQATYWLGSWATSLTLRHVRPREGWRRSLVHRLDSPATDQGVAVIHRCLLYTSDAA